MENFSWSDHGLAGLVIGALFLVLFLIIRMGVEKFGYLSDQHKESVERLSNQNNNAMSQLHNEHKIERQDWKMDMLRQGDRVETVVRELTEAIKEIDTRRHDDVADLIDAMKAYGNTKKLD